MSRELLAMALDALDDPSTFRKTFNARAALRAALAAPESEPVAQKPRMTVLEAVLRANPLAMPPAAPAVFSQHYMTTKPVPLCAAPPAAPAPAVSAAKDAEIVQLRAELIKSLADNAALRERVRVLEDALRGMVIANERHSFLRVGDALTAARAALEKP